MGRASSGELLYQFEHFLASALPVDRSMIGRRASQRPAASGDDSKSCPVRRPVVGVPLKIAVIVHLARLAHPPIFWCALDCIVASLVGKNWAQLHLVPALADAVERQRRFRAIIAAARITSGDGSN